ncbi:MAG: VWA domain-containing protein [Pseudomonadota bacterium]
MRGLIYAVTIFVSLIFVSFSQAQERAIIVFDASGSMWGQIDGKSKIEIARETMGRVLPSLPGELELGLIAYGHRKKGDCGDIQSMVKLGKGNQSAVSNAVNGLTPKGKTPLSDAVRMAADALKYTEDKATVILLTDGVETCNADPCALANELEGKGVDFTAHVVGFGLSQEEGKQVSCLAENTGGKFILAKDAAELGSALEETVVAVEAPKAPEPEPVTEPIITKDNVRVTARLSETADVVELQGRYDFYKIEGDEIAKRRSAGGYDTEIVVTLDPGTYLLRYKKQLVTYETSIAVPEGELVEQDINLNAGILNLSVAAEASLEPDKKARIDVYGPNKTKDGGYGPKTFLAPAGELELVAKLGNAKISEKISLNAGDVINKKLIAAAGRLVGSAVYSESGEKVEARDIRFDVLSAKKDLQGKRKKVDGSYKSADYMLPPGKYVLRAKLGAAISEVPFEIEGGSLTEAEVNLNAGVLAAIVPGAYRVDVFSAKKDLQGKRKKYDGSYYRGEGYQVTLVAGEYVLAAKIGDRKGDVKEVTFSIKAGERTELTLE